MDNKRNYYRLLHVQFDAPAAVIKSSYRTMMQKLKHHPDLGGDESLAKALNEALETLLDTDKRDQYDRWLQKNHPHYRPSRAATGVTAIENIESASALELASTYCSFCQKQFVNNPLKQGRNWGLDALCTHCSAPLALVSHCLSTQLEELRRLQRVSLPMNVSVVLCPNTPSHPMQLIDFSTQGLALESRFALKSGQRVLIKSQYLGAVAEVVYCQRADAGCWRIGVQFCTLLLDMPKGGLISNVS